MSIMRCEGCGRVVDLDIDLEAWGEDSETLCFWCELDAGANEELNNQAAQAAEDEDG